MKKSRLMAAAGAAAVFVAATALSSLAAHAGIPKRMTAVEATKSIPAGTEIRTSDLTTVTFHGQPPTGIVTAIGGAAGKLAAHRIAKGEILFLADVSKGVERDGLKPGEVGFMVPVSLTTAGEATPGSRVDVIAGTSAKGYAATGGKVAPAGATVVGYYLRVVQVVTSSNAPASKPSGKTNSALSSGNVPAAVELAVPLAKAVQLTQIQYGGESLTLVLAPWEQKGKAVQTTDTVGTPVKGGFVPSASTPATVFSGNGTATATAKP
jgi:Flp pilus assembly protein CpaB